MNSILNFLFTRFQGMPTDSPKNITTRFQTPDVIEISYDPPPEEARNGQVSFLENFETEFYDVKNLCLQFFLKQKFSLHKFCKFNKGKHR